MDIIVLIVLFGVAAVLGRLTQGQDQDWQDVGGVAGLVATAVAAGFADGVGWINLIWFEAAPALLLGWVGGIVFAGYTSRFTRERVGPTVKETVGGPWQQPREKPAEHSSDAI